MKKDEKSIGYKQPIPEEIKKKMEGVSMQHFCGITYEQLSYLTIPYYDFNGNVQNGHMVVNSQIADEVLKIFQELFIIKYPIEKMQLIDDFTGENKLIRDELDYAALEANNTVESIDGSFYTDNKDGNSINLIEKISSDKNEEEYITNKLAIKQLIEGLEDRDKEIILLRFYKDKTQSQVAKILGITQVQVSRLERKILENMKMKLIS